jgi:hypothetical protein
MDQREVIADVFTAHTLLKREVAIAMHLELKRGPTFTATLDEMLTMPEIMVPFAFSGQEMMDKLGNEGVKKAILERMIPKINDYYTFNNWADALKQSVVYDSDHIIKFSEYVTPDMFV